MPLEHEDVQGMTFIDCRCNHPSETVLKYVTREFEKQVYPKCCDVCHNFIYFYGQFLI